MGYNTFKDGKVTGPGLHQEQMHAQVQKWGFALDYAQVNDLGFIQKINFFAANRLFPDRTDATMFLKLYGEIAELVEGKNPEDEVADVIIMMLDYAQRKGIHAGAAVMRKLEINLNRTWIIDPITGVAQHVD